MINFLSLGLSTGNSIICDSHSPLNPHVRDKKCKRRFECRMAKNAPPMDAGSYLSQGLQLVNLPGLHPCLEVLFALLLPAKTTIRQQNFLIRYTAADSQRCSKPLQRKKLYLPHMLGTRKVADKGVSAGAVNLTDAAQKDCLKTLLCTQSSTWHQAEMRKATARPQAHCNLQAMCKM